MAYNEDVNINLNILAGAMGGITAIAGGMSALTSTFGQFGTTAVDAFGTLDGLVVSAAALVGTFGLQAASAAGEFEQGMKIVQAVSGQTGSAIQQLGEEANKLSVEYRTAIGDITEGLQTLGRAGLNSADSQLEVLESGLQTAKLEGRNLNSVLEELIQNTAMLGGNLDALDFGQQTEYVNSLMVGTSMSAPIDTHDISQTLQYVGGTAAAAGANLEDKEKLEDLMGTIAAFAQKGVTGSMAGTALRAFLTKPASQDKSVVEGLGRIGLAPEDLWEDGGEKMKDISDQIALIKNQMDRLNLSTMDQLEIWGKIVGPKMGQQMLKLDADKIDELKGNIQEAASAEELATSTLNTYNQKINEMGRLGDIVFRGIGSKFIMFLNPVVEIISKILELLGNPTINTGVFILVFALISNGLQKAYGMITSIFRQIREGLSGVTPSIQSLNGPMNQATTSAAAFKSEIYQIIEATAAMNSNIAQTGTLSGAMQAHLLGKKGTGYIPGYEDDKTLARNVVGISDSYKQYFAKPQMATTYTGLAPRSSSQLDADMTAFSNFKKEMNEKGIHNVKTIQTAAIEKGVISGPLLDQKTGRPLDTAPMVKTTISEDEYKSLSKKEKERFTANDPHLVDPGRGYISTRDYNNLDAEAKKQYQGQNYRLEARYGTEAQMKDEIRKSTDNLRIFNGTTAEWNRLSKAEQDAIRSETQVFRKAKRDELESMAVKGGKDAFGRDVYGYTTMHNIPQSKTLAELMSIEGKQKGPALNTAMQKQMAAEMTAAYRQSLGTMGKLQTSAFEKMGRYAGMVTSTASKINSGFGTLRTGVVNLSRTITGESGSLRGSLRNMRNSITNESGGVRTAFRNMRQSIVSGLPISDLRTRLSLFGAQLGLSSTSLQTLSSSASSQMAAMSLVKEETMSVSTLITKLSTELNITDKQFVQLIQSSEALKMKFAQLAQEKTGASPTEVGNVMGDISKKGGRLSKAFGSVIGFLGGPFSAALMGVTVVIQAVQQAFQDWQKRIQQASTELKESQNKMKDAEEGIKEIYKKENEDASEEQLKSAVNEQYESIYDYYAGDKNLNDLADIDIEGDVENGVNGLSVTQEENVYALGENTRALMEATAEYRAASDKVNAELTDDWFGMDGAGSIITDKLGKWGEQLSKRSDPRPGAWDISSGREIADGILKNNGPVLTGSQKDDKYEGSKEFAGVFAADMFRFGVEGGLQQFFGSDYDTIIGLLRSMDSKVGKAESGLAALETHSANFAPTKRDSKGNVTGVDYQKAAAMQTELKNNKPLYQQLGRDMYTYEKATNFKRSAYNDVLGKRQQKDAKKMSKQELRALNNVNKTLKRIQALTGTKLDQSNILAMAQLQQLGDMYQLGVQEVAPGIDATVQRVGYNGMIQQGIAGEAAGSGAGAVSAGQNAAAIAALLGAYLQAKVEEQAYNEAVRSGAADRMGVKSLDEYRAKLGGATPGGSSEADKQLTHVYELMGRAAYATEHAGENVSPEDIKAAGERRAQEVIRQRQAYGTDHQTALDTMTTPGVLNTYRNQVLASYGEAANNANRGGSGGGGGGGDGGGGGGSADDSGKNTKNRVDLVLCNKKEIPKLNVNLFKKEPNFTVLNKNFKLRDIKINTKDTPKSILDAVKNGIIDTAKRMDPKIIQDEEAVYDPMGATEGTPTPSGTTPTG